MNPVFPTEAERHRHLAMVCAREAMSRRLTQPAFASELDTWAANAEARASAAETETQPDQLELFNA